VYSLKLKRAVSLVFSNADNLQHSFNIPHFYKWSRPVLSFMPKSFY